MRPVVGEGVTMGRNRVVDSLVLRGARGVGDRAFRCLVDAFGSPGAALDADAVALEKNCGATPALVAALAACRDLEERARGALVRVEAAGFTAVAYGQEGYPERLAAIPDPPSVLYLAGDSSCLAAPAVAVVGSRKASTHGVRFARRLAADLAAAGFTVVSGLAQGIDAAAHRGALDVPGGRTVAVFGCGLDVIYPPRHAELSVAVRNSGAWVSEFPLGAAPGRHHFPRRNRVISGLTQGVVVVEASDRSGSLITASCALEQGREVFAVPGLPGSFNAQGAHRLLRDGARLVDSAADVLEELGAAPAGAAAGTVADARPEPPAELRPLWKVLEDAPLHIDELAAAAGVSAAEASAALMELVLGGYAEQWAGGRFVRTGP
ncbi:MAG: DNA-processing protein DprA [Deferrisomatales bacterium]|nr:DNA-processing protein DprA [Deferrisomatales bacterium]